LWFLGFYDFNFLTNAGNKFTTHKQRFGHVNATNRNSYLNIVCIKLVTQVRRRKNQNSDFCFEVFRFLKNLKFGLLGFLVFKPKKT